MKASLVLQVVVVVAITPTNLRSDTVSLFGIWRACGALVRAKISICLVGNAKTGICYAFETA